METSYLFQNLTKHTHSAAVFPGGMGAASTLCNFAEKGEHCTPLPEVKELILNYHKDKKLLGFICIAPVLAASLIKGVTLTIGTDKNTCATLKAMGAHPILCQAST